MSSSIRLLILSDTHSKWPYTPANPAPKADVFIHCRDLTQAGGLASFKRTIADIKTIDAPLKLIIAGNHDLDLDEVWVRKNMED
ncbi:MAG: metallophosphoesterase, partial [Rhizobium sp.]|nr:metallophosphoesterase [Rhizobium sp.]